MAHIVLLSIFTFVFTRWLAYEFKIKHLDYLKQGKWFLGAIFLQIVASFVWILVGGISGNFLLHAIGGGMASTLLYEYLKRTFAFKPGSWRLDVVMLFAFVSTLGVLNVRLPIY